MQTDLSQMPSLAQLCALHHWATPPLCSHLKTGTLPHRNNEHASSCHLPCSSCLGALLNLKPNPAGFRGLQMAQCLISLFSSTLVVFATRLGWHVPCMEPLLAGGQAKVAGQKPQGGHATCLRMSWCAAANGLMQSTPPLGVGPRPACAHAQSCQPSPTCPILSTKTRMKLQLHMPGSTSGQSCPGAVLCQPGAMAGQDWRSAMA